MSEPTTLPVSAQQLEAAQREQCWECKRRRRVCDGTQPVCNKCRTSKIVCPGYLDKKPLTWLAPGQVMSRARKKKGPRKSCNNTNTAQQKGAPVTPPSSDSASDVTGSDDKKTDDLDIGRPVELRPEVCDVFEALMYYNTRIYPDLVKNQLGPSGFVLPMAMVENVSPSIIHTLVSIVISHRIIQLAENPASDELVKPMWTRLYRHRDIAIRAINKRVADEATRSDIVTISAVYTLLFAMLQQSQDPRYRTHVGFFMSLVRLRGTFSDLIRALPPMELSLMAMCIVGVFANTTSPHDDFFHVTSTSETLQLVATYYTESYFPSVAIPPPLFTEIILINDLRPQPPSPETALSATALLARIESFSPSTWSAARPPAFQDDWLLLSSIFHAAVALYAILSLQSSGALADDAPELELARARHARALFASLETAMATPRVKRRMTWPLVVAGVEAARAGREVQRYIGDRLREMSRDHGSAPPLVARGVLERFWAGGGGRWDECFREPLALIL